LISVIQRVSQAPVRVGDEVIGEIGTGLMVLLFAERGDTQAQADKLLDKLLKLRIFSDAPGVGPPQARLAPWQPAQLHRCRDARQGTPALRLLGRAGPAGASVGADRAVCGRHAGAAGQ